MLALEVSLENNVQNNYTNWKKWSIFRYQYKNIEFNITTLQFDSLAV